MSLDYTKLRTGKVETGTRINCYRNLNLLKYGVVGWSIQTYVPQENGSHKLLVVQHAKCVLVSDVIFKPANDVQVDRCQSKCREVCAWLKGVYQGSCLSREGFPGGTWNKPVTPRKAQKGKWRRLRCDPKKGRGDFYDDKTGKTVEQANFVFVDAEGAAWYIPDK